MIGVDDDGGIFELSARFCVPFADLHDGLVVVIGDIVSVMVDSAAENDVRILIALRRNLIVVIHKDLRTLCGKHGIEGDGNASARRVFDSDRKLNAAGDKPMQLIFAGARADGDIGEQILYVGVIFGIEHLVCGGEPGFLDGADMEIADRKDALQNILAVFGIGLGEHAFIAYAFGARLVGVDARDKHELILYALAQPSEAADVFEHGRALMCGARPDDDKQFIAPARNDVLDEIVALCFDGGKGRRKRRFVADLLRRRNFYLTFKHGSFLS